MACVVKTKAENYESAVVVVIGLDASQPRWLVSAFVIPTQHSRTVLTATIATGREKPAARNGSTDWSRWPCSRVPCPMSHGPCPTPGKVNMELDRGGMGQA